MCMTLFAYISYIKSVVCPTSSVVPQNGDTPPLLHVGQFTARPKHCARTDKSTEEKTNKHTQSQSNGTTKPLCLFKVKSSNLSCNGWKTASFQYNICICTLCVSEHLRSSLPHHDQFVISSWCQVQSVIGPAHTVNTCCRDKHTRQITHGINIKHMDFCWGGCCWNSGHE